MVIKIFNQYKSRPTKKGEFFTQLSLTDQLADEPLQRIFQRYVSSGMSLPMVDGDIDIADNESIESALADTACSDPSMLTKLEQQDMLRTAELLVEQMKKHTAAQLSEQNSVKQADNDKGEPGTGEKKENAN